SGNAFIGSGGSPSLWVVVPVGRQVEHRPFPVIVVIPVVEFMAGNAFGLGPLAFVTARAAEFVRRVIGAQELIAVGVRLRPDRVVEEHRANGGELLPGLT